MVRLLHMLQRRTSLGPPWGQAQFPECNNEDSSCSSFWCVDSGSGIDTAGDPDNSAYRLIPYRMQAPDFIWPTRRLDRATGIETGSPRGSHSVNFLS